MSKEYVCENCGYRGDSYKLDFFNKNVDGSSLMGLLHPLETSLSGQTVNVTCPQCGQRAIKIDPAEVYRVPGRLPRFHWTAKSLFILVIIVTAVIVLPMLVPIFWK